MAEGWTLEQWIDGCHAAEALNVRYREEIARLTHERDEARAEVSKLHGWVNEAEQAAGRLQRERDGRWPWGSTGSQSI